MKMAYSAAVRTAPAAREDGQSPHYVAELYLYAFATQAEVLHHLRTRTSAVDRERLPAILETWHRLRPRVAAMEAREAGIAETIRCAPIPPEFHAQVQRVTDHPLFQKTFQDYPGTFEVLEIDKLVAPQRSVNLSYVEELTASFAGVPTFQSLVDICLSPVRPGAPIQHLQAGSNTHVFSSPSADFRALGSGAKETLTEEDLQLAEAGGVPSASVLAFVGYGCSTVNVFRVGKRAILNNGFHRVYALRSLGVTDIPVLVQHVHNVALEFPSEVNGFPSGYLLGSPRPVLCKDFLEPGFTIGVSVRERVRVVKVTMSASRYDVPV